MATLQAEGSLGSIPNATQSLIPELQSNVHVASGPSDLARNALAAGQYSTATSMGGIAVAQAAIQRKQTEAQYASAIAQSMQRPPILPAEPVIAPPLPLPSMPFNASTASQMQYRKQLGNIIFSFIEKYILLFFL